MRPELVVMGASLGGMNALVVVYGGLPKGFSLPVVVAQHRSKDRDEALAHILQGSCVLPVCEPDDKEPLCAGRIYLAPANYHLLVEYGKLCLSTEAPVCFSRPSVDVLFESAAHAYGSGLIGVILTGANADGAAGAARVKARGGLLIVQDPAEAEARAMPEAALATAQADHTTTLDKIAPLLASLC